jgi:hypothetical protein
MSNDLKRNVLKIVQASSHTHAICDSISSRDRAREGRKNLLGCRPTCVIPDSETGEPPRPGTTYPGQPYLR